MIELVLAPVSISIKSTENTGLAAAIPFATANVYKSEVNRTPLSVTTFSISTKSLDYVIGTFRLPNNDRTDLPLNTIFSPVQALQKGTTNTTAESQINAGCRRVYNQSRFFAHNGDSIKTTQW
jgi:hypothetical protein